MNAERITTDTTRELRALAAKFFRGDEEYRAWLGGTFGVASTLDLTEADGRRGCHLLRLHLGHATGRKRPAPPPHASGRPHRSVRYVGTGRKGYASALTSGQAVEIARLEDELGWTSDPKRLAGFMARTLRWTDNVVKLPSALTKAEATSLITALRRFLDARSRIDATPPRPGT